MPEEKNTAKLDKKRIRRDRREEILLAATRFLGEYGFRGTTLAMVAEEVGLTEPGVLHYFPSKIHLLQAVLEYRAEKDTEKYAKLIEAEKTNVAEFLGLLADYYADNEEIPELIQLFTVLVGESIHTDHPSHDYFVERYRQGREMYVKQFSTLIKSDIRSDVDLEKIASLIMALMDGLLIQWLLDPDSVDMLATFNLFSNMMSAYLERAN